MKNICGLVLLLIITTFNVDNTFSSTQNFLAGNVLQVMIGGGYKYVYIEQSDSTKKWVAVPDNNDTLINVGTYISFKSGMEMDGFESKALNKTFTNITFSEGILSDSKNKEQPVDTCEYLSDIGRGFMEARQNGAPISTIMRVIDESDRSNETKLMFETIANRAYILNVVSGQQTKKIAIEKFRNDTYSWCSDLNNSSKLKQ